MLRAPETPLILWICAAVFAVGGVRWRGRALYVIGGNAEAARTAGIRVDRIVWTVLIIGSLLAVFADSSYSGHYGSVSATRPAPACPRRTSSPASSACPAARCGRR